jgi:hypothetical protein
MGGAGPIPFTAMVEFANRYGIHDLEEFESFRLMMRMIDETYFSRREPKKGDHGETLYDINDWRSIKGIIRRGGEAFEAAQRLKLEESDEDEED